MRFFIYISMGNDINVKGIRQHINDGVYTSRVYDRESEPS